MTIGIGPTISGNHPVIGELVPYTLSAYEWGQYHTGLLHGLARVEGKRIDILVVVAERPGRGDFRRFLNRLQRAYRTVAFWEVGNRDLAGYLKRRGFVEVERVNRRPECDEVVAGLEWQGAATQ